MGIMFEMFKFGKKEEVKKENPQDLWKDKSITDLQTMYNEMYKDWEDISSEKGGTYASDEHNKSIDRAKKAEEDLKSLKAYITSKEEERRTVNLNKKDEGQNLDIAA